MTKSLDFHECLSHIDARSAALRTAIADAPDLGARVPACPDWALRDLVEHLGEVHRSWAAVVVAGPSDTPPSEAELAIGSPGDDLIAWSAESTGLLLAALRETGPDQGCWGWWGASEAPLTSGSVARHQVHEAAVHAYDAQEAAGRPAAVPEAVALDGVAEFLTVVLGAAGPWPHRPARIAVRADTGPQWTVDLTAAGAAVSNGAEGVPATTLHGPASDLLLALYRRTPLDRVRIEGDRALAEEVLAWPDMD
ncbi:uncharacterized protein (TIGR03083 family) [Murinocardiopsis flavida]|uniref:Uncharacterized protein (TIGR03083 family) n=1 Tax=Murinocardiopsis flavida TaxID=645275 RepID=A0A2P8D3I4_9ACTN|nr:maleylpyruvate isomerase family mycothiol-dependent enzyme [Murinocardiopsis flavida]PSK91739.1 uncharacterized protein (TIGR03083 family) [Murinocardiopsis flavida]